MWWKTKAKPTLKSATGAIGRRNHAHFLLVLRAAALARILSHKKGVKKIENNHPGLVLRHDDTTMTSTKGQAPLEPYETNLSFTQQCPT